VGYTRRHLSGALLNHPNAIVQNGVLAPEGAGYRTLIVNQQRNMEVTTAFTSTVNHCRRAIRSPRVWMPARIYALVTIASQ
jgi:hypothetical protein